MGINQDVTRRVQAEEEQERLKAQFAQAQRLESVGQLAGGVAHDYNNMLSVILGNVELAMKASDPDSPLRANLEGILAAAKRSRDITGQLLGFARRQTIAPRVVDLNDSVESLLSMLRRLIGEDIELTWSPGAETWSVKMDSSQIDQIMVNLCINARDAIDGVGKITIETSNLILDGAPGGDHVDRSPGCYVQLGVSDDGCGMDEETRARVFEPFFSTKDASQGSGLGLATVYGIVKQNGGFIDVESEAGSGTTIRLFFPRHGSKAEKTVSEGVVETPLGRGETVLLVEDESAILDLGSLMLRELGYRTISASSPTDALRQAAAQTSGIRLLITDVVMPEMNGRELADQVYGIHPGMKVLFMSGYPADVIANRGVLDSGVSFIQKPFSIQELGAKVRAVLDR